MLAKDIPLTLAAISGTVGAVVVVFILFGLQAFERENVEEPRTADRLPMIRETAAIRLLLGTSSVAMVVLLLTPVFLLYNLATQALRPKDAVAIGLGSFSFSVTTLLVGLFSYFIVSTIRSRRLSELPGDLKASAKATDIAP
jgi:hypothetical protein